MIRISIFCEDYDKGENLSQTIQKRLDELKINCLLIIVNSYDAARKIDFDALLKSDLCFLDFTEFNKSLQLAVSLTEKKRDLMWVCVGTNISNLLNLLLLRPSGYIQDIKNTDYINRLIDRLVQFLQHRETSDHFSFKCDGDYIKIPYSNISYFESSAKKVTLHVYNSPKKYYFTAKLEDIQNKVPSSFLRCHQSYMVNMKCIRYFDTKNKVIIALPNEEVLVSRRMFVASKQAYEAFLQGKQVK